MVHIAIFYVTRKAFQVAFKKLNGDDIMVLHRLIFDKAPILIYDNVIVGLFYKGL